MLSCEVPELGGMKVITRKVEIKELIFFGCFLFLVVLIIGIIIQWVVFNG